MRKTVPYSPLLARILSRERSLDYWMLLLWKRRMGTAVLNTTRTPIPKDKERLPDLHVYAHCSRTASDTTRTNGSDGTAREGGVGNGSITLAFINISPSATCSLNLLNLSLGLNSMVNKGRRYDYIFSTPHGVLSEVVALNFKRQALVDGPRSIAANQPI
jgi:hypothetical protein